MSTLWALLLSLLCVTVGKAYFEHEDISDSRAFFQDDESMIQDEADFQYIHEAKENMNEELAEKMSYCKTLMERNGEIQDDYKSSLRKDLEFICPPGSGIYYFESTYSSFRKDRQWTYRCRKVSDVHDVDCKWEDSIAGLGKRMSFHCPKNYYLSGVRSTYNKHANDRMWDAYCCKSKDFCSSACHSPRRLNQAKKHLTHTSNRGFVFAGLASDFKSGRLYKDRIWGLQECKYAACGGEGVFENLY